MTMENRPLSRLCCERGPDSDEHRQRVLRLIEAGADLHETDKNGVTPLHHAVRFRNPGAVEALIASGAEIDRQCKRSGSTPLHRAVTSTGAPGTAGRTAERLQIIRQLLEAGAATSIANKYGKTPADYATDAAARDALERASGKVKSKR